MTVTLSSDAEGQWLSGDHRPSRWRLDKLGAVLSDDRRSDRGRCDEASRHARAPRSARCHRITGRSRLADLLDRQAARAHCFSTLFADTDGSSQSAQSAR